MHHGRQRFVAHTIAKRSALWHGRWRRARDESHSARRRTPALSAPCGDAAPHGAVELHAVAGATARICRAARTWITRARARSACATGCGVPARPAVAAGLVVSVEHVSAENVPWVGATLHAPVTHGEESEGGALVPRRAYMLMDHARAPAGARWCSGRRALRRGGWLPATRRRGSARLGWRLHTRQSRQSRHGKKSTARCGSPAGWQAAQHNTQRRCS